MTMICATEILRTKIVLYVMASFLILANLLLNYFDLAEGIYDGSDKNAIDHHQARTYHVWFRFPLPIGYNVIKNLSKLKEYLKSDKALAPYAEKILRGNADKLFKKIDELNKLNITNSYKSKSTNMKTAKKLQVLLFLALVMLSACRTTSLGKRVNGSGMLVRISEIEIYRDSLPAYKAILKEEAEASVRLEPGVISIFPMYQQKDSTQIRILEIYANTEAYQSHIKSPHFQKYKTTTLSMVKELRLIDMYAMDPETMRRMFSKLKD